MKLTKTTAGVTGWSELARANPNVGLNDQEIEIMRARRNTPGVF